MQVNSQLLDSSLNPKPWNAQKVLPVCDSSHVAYSRGFLRINFPELLDNFSSYWKLLEHSLSVQTELISAKPQFSFPENLSRIVPIEVGGEAAVIGMDDESQKLLSNIVVEGTSGVSADVILEYFERRFLTCLNNSWKPEPLKSLYLAESQPSEVDIISVVSVEFLVNSKKCTVWFGLGPKVLGILDKIWKDMVKSTENSIPNLSSSQTHSLSLDLAYLAIEPAMLIDYTRSGSVVGLGSFEDSKVSLSLNSQPFAEGTLVSSDSKFAIEIENLTKEPLVRKDNNTFVSVQLGETTVETNSLKEICQEGAIFQTDIDLVDKVRLVVSQEVVANGIVGSIDNNFALTILPR